MSPENYEITLLFSKDNINKEELKKSCLKIFRKHLEKTERGNTTLKVKDPEEPENVLFMTLSGPEDDLFSCQTILHNKITTFPFELPSATLIKDDVGKELREEAYPILAEVENRVRRFIQKRAIEVKGFEWYEKAKEDQKERVNKIREKNDLASFIDYTFFKDLLTDLVKPPWEDKTDLTINDLKELLADSDSIEDVQEGLREKTEDGLWVQVFSDYFSDKEDWDELKESLDPEDSTLIHIRNKVMHHRPISPNDLEELEEEKNHIFEILNKAKKSLEPEEREKAKKKLNKLSKPIAGPLMGEQIKKLAESYSLPQKQVQAFAQAVQPLTGKQLKDMLGAYQPSKELAESMRKATQPSEKMLEQMRKVAEMKVKQIDLIKPQLEEMMQGMLKGIVSVQKQVQEDEEDHDNK